MRRFAAALPIRGALAGAALAVLLGVPAAPGTAAPEPQVHGAYCPPAGCTDTPRSSASTVAGLALVTTLAGLLRRRGLFES